MTGLLVLDRGALGGVLLCLDVQDLLHLSRCCQRLHHIVQQAHDVWQQLYVRNYPTAPPLHGDGHHTVCYRELFKQRWLQDARELRLQRKVQRMRLQSDTAQLQREIKQMEVKLKHEGQQQHQLDSQLRQLRHARLVSKAADKTQWQLNAVHLYHNKVVQATPVQLEAQLANLQQQQHVSRLEVKTLKAAIQSRRQRLAAVSSRLAAFEG